MVLGGGDFNLIRRVEDKSSNNINYNLIDSFNGFIADNNLMEIKRGGPRFTWRNKQFCPIIVELDRILILTNWEARFPFCMSCSLTRVGSNHCPIVLDTRERGARKSDRFYFEKKWFCQDNFKEVVMEK